jgi:hypothetical protein
MGMVDWKKVVRWAGLVAFGLVAFKYFPSSHAVATEPTAAPTAVQTAQENCAKQVAMDYNQTFLELLKERGTASFLIHSRRSTWSYLRHALLRGLDKHRPNSAATTIANEGAPTPACQLGF